MSSRSTDPRSPCLVGTARRTWRQDETTPEPLEQWAQLARAALVDAADGARSSATVDLDAVDHVGLVHCQSWAYDDPGVRLAEQIGRAHV